MFRTSQERDSKFEERDFFFVLPPRDGTNNSEKTRTVQIDRGQCTTATNEREKYRPRKKNLTARTPRGHGRTRGESRPRSPIGRAGARSTPHGALHPIALSPSLRSRIRRRRTHFAFLALFRVPKNERTHSQIAPEFYLLRRLSRAAAEFRWRYRWRRPSSPRRSPQGRR
jgi:hypothetical protein